MSKSFLYISFFTLFLSFSLPYRCIFAATSPQSPFRAKVQLSRVYETLKTTPSHEEIQAVPTVSIKGRVRNIGFVDARFSLRRNKTWSAKVRKNGYEIPDTEAPVLLQGRLAVGGAWRHSGRRMFPSAAAIIGNTLKVSFPGRATGSKASRQRLYTITVKLDGSIIVRASVASIPRSAGRRGACGAAAGLGSLATHTHNNHDQSHHTEGSDVIRPLTANVGAGATVTSRVITISTDADEEWYQRYGEQSNGVIASIINSAETIFNQQLGIRFRIVQQHVYAQGSPYTTTDSSKLLAAFAMNSENKMNLGEGKASFHQDVDLKHLFTGKDLDGSTIGIAYIGTVCALPTMSYGITQAYMDIANPAIFAHELGHNFGANHDVSSSQGLMYPAISLPPAQGFSDISLAEINNHLTRYGTCISLEELAPLPQPTPSVDSEDPQVLSTTPAYLSLKRKRVTYEYGTAVRLSGVLLSQDQSPIKSVGIVLIAQGQEVGRAVTSAKGRYTFLIRLNIPRGQGITVHAQVAGTELSSQEISFTSSHEA